MRACACVRARERVRACADLTRPKRRMTRRARRTRTPEERKAVVTDTSDMATMKTSSADLHALAAAPQDNEEIP